MTNRLALCIPFALGLSVSGSASSDTEMVRAEHPPIECGDNDRHVLRRAYIEAERVAIKATGSCSVTIEDSIIVGGKDGLVVGGSASVRVKRSTVYGGKSGLRVSGSASVSISSSDIGGRRVAYEISGTSSVDASSSTFRGKRRIGKTAVFTKKGRLRNLRGAKAAPQISTKTPHVAGEASAKQPADAESEPTGPARRAGVNESRTILKPVSCDKRDTIVIKNAIINAKGVAVRATGRCIVTIKNSVIQSTKGEAIYADGSTKVTIESSTVGGKTVGIRGSGATRITVRASRIRGKKSVVLDGAAKTNATSSVFRGKQSIGRAATFTNRKR